MTHFKVTGCIVLTRPPHDGMQSSRENHHQGGKGSMKFNVFTIAFSTIFASATFADEIPAPTQKEWTILVFLNADNDLERFGFDDMREMEKVGSTDQVNVVVQWDEWNKSGSSRVYMEKSTQAYVEERNSFNSPIVMDMPEQDMGDWRVLADFMTWGIEKYPAKHYAVIIWNHGSGWKKQEGFRAVKGISYDYSSGTHITTMELDQAFLQVQGLLGRKIDVVGFDACLMAMLEIGDVLVPHADYLLASEEVIPGPGFAYDHLLSAFTSRDELSVANFLKDSVEQYYLSYSGGSQGTRQVQLSAFDLNKMAAVKEKLGVWLESLQSESGLTREQMLSAADETLNFSDSDYRDLGDYVSLVMEKRIRVASSESDMAFGTKSFDLLEALRDATVQNMASNSYKRSTGMAIYLPYTSSSWSPWGSKAPTDRSTKERYLNLSFAASSTWPTHLDYLFIKPEGL